MLDNTHNLPKRPFKQVDVFTEAPQQGNPLGVVLDGTDGDGDLETERMQRFTNWTNLSECTFVVPPSDEGRAGGADYRIRIFSPAGEFPFAGHPTLGTAHAWLESGGVPVGERIVMECGLGLVEIRRDVESGRLAFASPPLLRDGPLCDDDLPVLLEGLGLEPEHVVDHQWCDNGPGWKALLLDSAERVLAIEADAQLLAGLKVGVVGPHPEGSEAAFELRAFFPGNNGLAEDPVTGSLNAAVAQWLIGAGIAPDAYVAAQGTRLDRAGRIHVERDADGTIWVGGGSVTCVDGTVVL